MGSEGFSNGSCWSGSNGVWASSESCGPCCRPSPRSIRFEAASVSRAGSTGGGSDEEEEEEEEEEEDGEEEEEEEEDSSVGS